MGGQTLSRSPDPKHAGCHLPLTCPTDWWLPSQVGRTLSKVQQVLSWSYGEDVKPFKPPLSDAEFHTYLNHEGQLSRPEELRLRIYHGGVEPSLRKVNLSPHSLVVSITAVLIGSS